MGRLFVCQGNESVLKGAVNVPMKIISLNLNSQFRRLYKKGKSFVTPTMVVYCMKNSCGVNRLGITAGKKIGGAVERNRAKRRIRELFRISQTDLQTGFDFCIVARGFTGKAPYERLTRDFCTSAKRLGVWKDEKDTY